MSVVSLRYTAQGKDYAPQTGSDENVTTRVKTVGDRTTVELSCQRAVTLRSAKISLPFTFHKKDKIFVNGYQSWTDTKEFTVGEKLNHIYRLPKKVVDTFSFDRYGDAPFKRYQKSVLHGYDVGYIQGDTQLFLASYNLKNAYLILNFCPTQNEVVLEADIEGLTLAEGQTFTLFDFMVDTDISRGKAKYFATFRPKTEKKMIGYTSWYNHYQNITESIIMENLAAMDPAFELFQIDDGFEPFVGDWLKEDEGKFPHGLAPIVEEIHKKGLLAGIWLAPFAAEQKSELFNAHPDWFLQQDGVPVRCGCNWSGFYALNFYHPEARAYVTQVLQRFLSLGFDFFKLDFLYACAAVVPQGKTRAQVTAECYAYLRDILGDKLILGCGGNLSSAAETFDYMRVGPDVSLIFDDVFYMRFMHRERISTKVTLQNTVYRSLFDGAWFGADPDVFLLRDDNVKLSPKQREALATLNALFGSVLMTSDNFALYDQAKKDSLKQVLNLFRLAKVTKYGRQGKYIHVDYTVEDKPFTLTYDTQKGVLL